jgi:hypothetical protein
MNQLEYWEYSAKVLGYAMALFEYEIVCDIETVVNIVAERFEIPSGEQILTDINEYLIHQRDIH